MAADGAWPSIEKHGLLSTASLVERWEVESDLVRSTILDRPREDSTVIESVALGPATIRDQKAIHEPSLASSLIGMTVPEWLAMLNERVFFFVHATQLATLMRSRSYIKDAHTVLTIDTRRFVEAHENEIEITQMNSGFSQRHNAKRRGRATFVPLREFTHALRDISQRKTPWDISELCVRGAVQDIRDHVIRVERVRNGEVPTQIY